MASGRSQTSHNPRFTSIMRFVSYPPVAKLFETYQHPAYKNNNKRDTVETPQTGIAVPSRTAPAKAGYELRVAVARPASRGQH